MKRVQYTSFIRYVFVVAVFFASAIFGPTPNSVVFGQNISAAGSRISYNVRDYGAKGDGMALDSIAINKAIEAAAANGGGTVFFPAGNYRSFSIRLKSNISLYFDQGSVLVAASPNDGDGKYDPPEPNRWDKYQDFGHSHWHNSLIWGENLENISILGPGLIWGKGLVRSGGQSRTQEQQNALPQAVNGGDTPFGYPNARDAVENGWGNKAISLKLCRNVIIRDVSILHGGHFAILATGVDNLTIDNLKIDTNRDGIDIDACRHVRISNTTVNSPFDDAICLKSSYGLGFARATENVTITNCEVTGYDEGTFLDGTYKRDYRAANGTFSPTGRIKFGTESNGGFKNITISNCVFEYCRGLALEAVDGALLEDVTINNITLRDIANSPIFLRLGNRARGPKESTTIGKLRRVKLSNIVVYNADPKQSSIISGIPGNYIEDIQLSNIRIYAQGGGTAADAALDPPENETAYPEPTMFGLMPAYGFFVRHVTGLTMNDVEVSYLKDDLRPAFVMKDIIGLDLNRVKVQRSKANKAFILKDILDFTSRQVTFLGDGQANAIKSKEY